MTSPSQNDLIDDRKNKNTLSQIILLTNQVSSTLKGLILDGKFGKHRSFYGEAFSYLFFSNTYSNNPKLLSTLNQLYLKKDQNAENFHWEFNNWAISEILKTPNSTFKFNHSLLKFKNTKCTNWQFLKFHVQALNGIESNLILSNIKTLLTERQSKSGLILDEKNEFSFHYHVFSLFMLIETYQLIGRPEVIRSNIQRAWGFTLSTILSNGRALYIGRGQEQIFGYGALIALLTHPLLRNDKSIKYCERVLKLISELSQDYIPLTLTKEISTLTNELNTNNLSKNGWYHYNNYLDYLPFFGVMLQKSINNLYTLSHKTLMPLVPTNNFPMRLKKTERFIIGTTFSQRISSSQVLPFIYSIQSEDFIIPPIGGEQFREDFDSNILRNLPIFKLLGRYRPASWKAISFSFGSYLILISPFSLFIRSFKVTPSNIKIQLIYLSPFPFHWWLTLPVGTKGTIDDKEIKEFTVQNIFKSSFDNRSLYRIKKKTRLKLKIDLN